MESFSFDPGLSTVMVRVLSRYRRNMSFQDRSTASPSFSPSALARSPMKDPIVFATVMTGFSPRSTALAAASTAASAFIDRVYWPMRLCMMEEKPVLCIPCLPMLPSASTASPEPASSFSMFLMSPLGYADSSLETIGRLFQNVPAEWKGRKRIPVPEEWKMVR